MNLKIFHTKKGSLIVSPFIILSAAILILVLFIVFFIIMSNHIEDRKIILKAAEDEVSDNIFLVGLLRSEVKHNGETMQLSELLSLHYLKVDSASNNYEEEIKNNINAIMLKTYGKRICWSIATDNFSIKETSNCEGLLKNDVIKAETFVPTYSKNVFKLNFETVSP